MASLSITSLLRMEWEEAMGGGPPSGLLSFKRATKRKAGLSRQGPGALARGHAIN